MLAMTEQSAQNAATGELVDRVAEAMTGWPLSSTDAEDAEAWRANARAALAVMPEVRCETTEVRGRVVLLYGVVGRPLEPVQKIATDLLAAGAVLVVILDEGMSLDAVPPERMAEAGWVRKGGG